MVRAHACTRDDVHVYAYAAHVGAHADALATRGCTCVRARICMYDYYIICAGVACACLCARTCVYVRAFESICVYVRAQVRTRVRVPMCVCAYNYSICMHAYYIILLCMRVWCVRTCACVHVRTSMPTYMHARVRWCACACMFMPERLHVRARVCALTGACAHGAAHVHAYVCACGRA